VASGDKGEDHDGQANMRLVVSIAKRYSRLLTLTFSLIRRNAGTYFRAVEKFDWIKVLDSQLMHTWWIHQAITIAAIGTNYYPRAHG